MIDSPGILTAFAAGILSFLSPCVLPLIPSFLTVLTGSAASELRDQNASGALRRRVLARSVAFVLGFSVIFIVLGFALSSTSAMLGGASRAWGIAAGIAVVVLGLNFMFDFLKILNFEVRAHSAKRPGGILGAFAFGAAFAAGWSPCVGPILASILLVAGQGTSARAALLLTAYSLGLALPFLLTGMFFGRMEKAIRAMTGRLGAIKTISGLFLAAVGLSMIFGAFQDINGILARAGYALEAFAQGSPGTARIAAVAAYLVLAPLPLLRRLLRGDAPAAAFRRPAASAALAVFGLAAIAEAVGILNTAGALAGWLLYQGI